ncbi:MAG: hypothetical protein FJX29_15025 [Alphaproteobacteria bacterium]|nr:hypothetical protein [Alphaproteobacteria bacterium]
MLAVVYIAIAAYLVLGFCFALPFAVAGAQRLLPEPAHLSPGARLAVIPGAIMLWPWLLMRWIARSRTAG